MECRQSEFWETHSHYLILLHILETNCLPISFEKTHNHSLIIHHILDRLFTNSLAQNNWVATTETQFFETISSQFEHTTHAFQTCGQSEIWHILKSDWLPIPSPKMNGWPPLRHNVWKQISSKLNIGQTRMKCRKFEIWETHDHRYVLPGQARLTVAPLHRSHRHSHGCACSAPLTKLQPTQNPLPHIGSIQNRGGPISIPRTKAPELKCYTHAIQAKIITIPKPSKVTEIPPTTLGSSELVPSNSGFGDSSLNLKLRNVLMKLLAICNAETPGVWLSVWGSQSVLHLLHSLVLDGGGGGEEEWWMDETWMVDECDGWSMLLLKETKSRDAWNFPTPPELWRSSLYTRVQVESLKLQFFGSLILGVDKLSFIVQVLESLSKSKVETPIHDSIRGLITWDCKEHGVKSWMY